MITRYCYYEGTMYIVDHIIRLDKSAPFNPFVYVGECEATMHAQGKSIGATYIIDSPYIMHLDEAVDKYPEFFI